MDKEKPFGIPTYVLPFFPSVQVHHSPVLPMPTGTHNSVLPLHLLYTDTMRTCRLTLRCASEYSDMDMDMPLDTIQPPLLLSSCRLLMPEHAVDLVAGQRRVDLLGVGQLEVVHDVDKLRLGRGGEAWVEALLLLNRREDAALRTGDRTKNTTRKVFNTCLLKKGKVGFSEVFQYVLVEKKKGRITLQPCESIRRILSRFTCLSKARYLVVVSRVDECLGG